MRSTSIPPCLRCRSPLEAGDLRCSVCAAPAPVRPSRAARATRAIVLRCRGCSAALRYDPRVRAPLCAFCGEVLVLEERADPPEEAREFLPLLVTAEAARAALKGWLAELGPWRPSDLHASASVESLQPSWWVGWVFDARADVTWTADSEVGARRAAWAPHAGRATLDFEHILVSASRGLSDEETALLAPSYDLSSARLRPEGAQGEAVVEEFDLQRSAARGRVLDAAQDQAIARVRAECVPGKRARNVRTAALISRLTTRRVAFPVWIMAYRYRGELYRLVVSGQDASCLMGRAPWSVLKLGLLILAGLALVALVGWLVSR